ncbi:MAG TPA: phage tail sheath subtilisin-like domain-containing protein, partial [Thermodesulfobacteriota bacterium]
IRILSGDEAEQQFGRGSMLAAMCRALKANNATTETWAFPLEDNPAGTAATGSITVGGVASAAGTLTLYVAGIRVQVAVAAGQTLAQIATALAAALTAKTELPVTAAVDGVDQTKVNVTARHKGEAGNSLDLRINYLQGEALPAGLTVTIVQPTGGTGNPDVTAVFTAIGDAQYHTIILPYTDAANLTVVETELAERFGPLKQIEGHAYAAAAGTHAALGTLGDSRNSPHVSIMGASGSPTPPYEWAAAFGAVIAFHGQIDPARPFQTLPLVGILPPAESARFTREERDLLLHDGISTFTVDAGGQVRIERAITTYKTNAFGLPDPSYLDVNTLLTLAFLRFSVRTRIAQKFPRHKLAGDDAIIGPGQAIVTPSVLRLELIALFQLWQEAGLVEDLEQFKRDLVVEIDATDPNRVNALIPPNCVNQFRVFTGLLQFRR